MTNFFKKYWLIIIIVLFAAFLRFWKLDTYPALNADEAAIGYNAYSLIQTGKDEHGNSWPIHFQSFNDYKPGLYFYLVLPFVKFISLNEWAVRIPNAFLGVLTVFIVYFLVKELFQKERLALVSALFLAISPWHIHFSRGGWEVNTATFFLTFGILLFLKALKKPSTFTFAVCFLTLILSLYTYHAARIIVPLLGFGVLGLYRKESLIKNNFRPLLISSLLAILLLIPLAKDLVSGGVFSRAAGVGLFADKGPINRINEQRGEHGNVTSLVGKLVHNKVANYGLAFFENWADHYHGEFLFLTGDAIQRNKVPETGQMYLFDILFLTVGFIVIFRNLSKSWKLIIWWLLVAPVAAALTFQAPHALRAENMIIPLVIVSALGFTRVVDWLRNKNFKVGLWLLGIFMVWLFGRYEHIYWSHMSKEFSFSSQYGVKELITYIKENGSEFKDIVVTDRYDQPYILFLFYLQYPPEDFQGKHSLTSRDEFGFSTVRDFDNFHFESINFQSAKEQYPGSLIVGTPGEILKEANIIKRIYGTNGFEYFDIVAN